MWTEQQGRLQEGVAWKLGWENAIKKSKAFGRRLRGRREERRLVARRQSESSIQYGIFLLASSISKRVRS
jgi:hypothetical protein